MKKIAYFVTATFVALSFIACVYAPRKETTRSAINALFYTGDPINQKIADDVIQGHIWVIYTNANNNFIAFYNTEKPNNIYLNIPNIEELDFVLEEATIISYLGFIKNNYGKVDNLTQEAWEHSKKTYSLILQNYIGTNYTVTNARKFKEYLFNSNPSTKEENIYGLGGTVKIEGSNFISY